MIIRLTVNDNDFSELLESYLGKLWANITCGQGNPLDVKCIMEKEKLRELLNPNTAEEPTAEQKAYLAEQIRASLPQFAYMWDVIQECRDEGEGDRDYVAKNLIVTFPDTFMDKDENGEAVYWFRRSQAVVCQ